MFELFYARYRKQKVAIPQGFAYLVERVDEILLDLSKGLTIRPKDLTDLELFALRIDEKAKLTVLNEDDEQNKLFSNS